jgi:methionyl-tRNA synthetase
MNRSSRGSTASGSPFENRKLAPYDPLLTRIDPKQVEAMVEASKESLQPRC